MKLVINQLYTSVKGINTITLYSSTTSPIVLRKYSEDKIIDSDFIEYGISGIIDKLKFNNDELINYFDNDFKELVGNNVDDFYKVENNYFLPTLSQENNDIITSSTKYFGSQTQQKQVLIVFEAGENVDKANLSEKETVDSVNDYNIQLQFEEEEITSKKVVFVSLTLETYPLTAINVSYNIWRGDINSFRNKYKHSLRNDEFFGTKNNIKVVGKKDNMLFDESNGVLVGYDKESITTPILNRKINKWKNKLNIFNKKIVYKLGDRVQYGDQIYSSLCDNNIGNLPPFSSKWIIEDNFKNYLTTKVNIVTDPLNSGETNPSGFISLSKKTNSYTFKITNNPGFELSASDTKTGEEALTDYTTAKKVGEESWEVTVTGTEAWRDILNNRDIKFHFNPVPYNITVLDNLPNGIIREVKVNGEIQNISQPISEVIANSPVQVKYSGLRNENYEIVDSIIASGIDKEGNQGSKTIQIQKDSDGNYFFEDNISFIRKTTYKVNIEKILHTMRVVGDLKYLEVERIFIETRHGDNFNVRFYKATNYKSEFRTHPKVIITGTNRGLTIQLDGNGQEQRSDVHGMSGTEANQFHFTLDEEGIYKVTGPCNDEYEVKIKVKNDN